MQPEEKNIHQENLSFINLRLEDKIFVLNNDFKVPEIFTIKIFEISKKPSNTNLYLKGSIISKAENVDYIIPNTAINKDNYKYLFLNKKDCIKKFKEVCIQQIIELTKAVENIKKNEN